MQSDVLLTAMHGVAVTLPLDVMLSWHMPGTIRGQSASFSSSLLFCSSTWGFQTAATSLTGLDLQLLREKKIKPKKHTHTHKRVRQLPEAIPAFTAHKDTSNKLPLVIAVVVSQRVRGGRFSRIYTGCWPSVYQTHWIWSVERQSAGEVGLHTDCKILYKFLMSEKTKQYLKGLEEHANEGKRQCEHNSVPSSLKNKYCTRLVMLKWVKRNDLHTSVCVIAQIGKFQIAR